MNKITKYSGNELNYIQRVLSSDEWSGTSGSANNELESLSMGMSNDFDTAIEFGATHSRLGSALFGPRLEKEEV